ncbi:MAG: glycosyltransferase family 2 protein [Candidatus Pacebacteria bacterium]|nr:glycosyltransferase family 2 protein [Candidatus Paceibacterota bacterium]
MTETNKENQPLITTIIPTYRRPHLLKRAITSVLNQTYPNFQVCIYDNASGDETAQIVKEISQKDPRVHYYCHSENIGIIQNFNFGLQQVNTPYFSFLSDDDILLPDFYEKALEGFQKYPEAGFVATQTIIASDKKVLNISCEDYEEKLYRSPEGLLKMINGGTSTWTSILFRREVIDKVGLLDEQVGSSSDLDYGLRISSVFPYAVIKSPGAIFYYNKLSLSSNWSMVEPLQWYKIILEKIRNNKDIPLSVREIAYQDFKRSIIRGIWLGGLIDVSKKRYNEAKKISQSLKNDFNENLKANIVYNAARLCAFSDVFYYLFIGLKRIRKSTNPKRRIKEKNLQKMYGQYLEYFRKYSSF